MHIAGMHNVVSAVPVREVQVRSSVVRPQMLRFWMNHSMQLEYLMSIVTAARCQVKALTDEDPERFDT